MNYKNIRSLLLVWIAAGVVSCHGDLDIMQDNKLSVSNMWKTSIQVENSTYGIYSAMRDNFVQDQVNVLTWGELRVGEYMWRNSRTETIWLADLRSVVHTAEQRRERFFKVFVDFVESVGESIRPMPCSNTRLRSP